MANERPTPVEHAIPAPDSSRGEPENTGAGKTLARDLLTKVKTLKAGRVLRTLAGRAKTQGKNQDIEVSPNTADLDPYTEPSEENKKVDREKFDDIYNKIGEFTELSGVKKSERRSELLREIVENKSVLLEGLKYDIEGSEDLSGTFIEDNIDHDTGEVYHYVPRVLTCLSALTDLPEDSPIKELREAKQLGIDLTLNNIDLLSRVPPNRDKNMRGQAILLISDALRESSRFHQQGFEFVSKAVLAELQIAKWSSYYRDIIPDLPKAVANTLLATKGAVHPETFLAEISRIAQEPGLQGPTLRALSEFNYFHYEDGMTTSYSKKQAKEMEELLPLVRNTIERPVIENFGLDYDALIKAWKAGGVFKHKVKNVYGKIIPYSRDRYKDNLDTICNLEAKKPGICKVLYEEFDIANFGRYTEEMLIDQYDQRDQTDLEYGAMLMAKADSNSAYYNRGKYAELYARAKKLGIAIRIFEVGSLTEAGAALIKAHRKYNGIKDYGERDNPIAFGYIAGHGTPEGVGFGELEEGEKESVPLRLLKSHFVAEAKRSTRGRLRSMTKYFTKGHRKDTANTLGRRVLSYTNIFAPKAPMLFDSCSTGDEGGIAETLSGATGLTTTGPDKPAAVTQIELSRDNSGILHLTANYTGKGVQQMTYTQGQRVDREEEELIAA